jgi:hypothetical protein
MLGRIGRIFGRTNNTDALRTSKPNKVELRSELIKLNAIYNTVITLTMEEKILLYKKIEILKVALEPQYNPFNQKVLNTLLTVEDENEIKNIIQKNPVRPLFTNFKTPPFNPKPELHFPLHLPRAPTDAISIQQSSQSSKKPLLSVNRSIDSGIPNSENLGLDLSKYLGVYDDELKQYINNRYDFLIKYCRCIRDFIEILKPQPPNSNSVPSTLFEYEEKNITKHKEEYSQKQRRHEYYTDVVYNIRLQQNHLVKLQELFTKLFTKPKQSSNEVDYSVKTYFTDEYFGKLSSMVTLYNNDVAKKHSEFYKQISKKGNTYYDLVISIIYDLDTLKSFVNDFKDICRTFVDYMVNTIDGIDKKKGQLQIVILQFRKLQDDQYLIDEILKDNINEKLKKSGGRRKPTTKKPKKSNHADMNMKDIRRLCKANQIKLSTTKDGVRIIYKKKELITKLKRRKIL